MPLRDAIATYLSFGPLAVAAVVEFFDWVHGR